VRAVQVLEFDRQEGRLGQDALAEKWWSFFNFQLLEKANDGMTIVGAVFKWSGQSRRPDVPEIVVAFRGTNAHNPESFVRDMNLNLHIFRNGLHKTTRFQKAVDLVQKYVSGHGAKNVWIAGHSLGAAIAMLVGRQMAEDGYLLEAHLFNPPFPSLFSALPQKIKSNLGKIRQFLLNYAGANGKPAVRSMDERSLSESERAFFALHGWFPCIYVNQNDNISAGYVDYFDQTQVMPVSIKHMLLSAIGIDSKVAHFIPSATLTLNSVPATDLANAHRIDQWLAPELITDCKQSSLFADVKNPDNVQRPSGIKYG
jgi:pimeloyl-ACP methyl ester carboxylesterase